MFSCSNFKKQEETIEWMKRYQEMLSVNENLRKKFDEFFTEKKDKKAKEDNKPAVIESDDYSSEDSYDSTDEGNASPPAKATKKLGFFGF